MADLLKGDFRGKNAPVEHSGWEGYDDLPGTGQHYGISGANITAIVVKTDGAQQTRPARPAKPKVPNEAQESQVSAAANAAVAKDRFEFTMPPALEPAIRCLASIGRGLIDRPSDLCEFVAALELVSQSAYWRSILSGLANNKDARVNSALVSSLLIDLNKAGDDAAVKRLRGFALSMKNNPAFVVKWYDESNKWAMPGLGDRLLDATSLLGRFVRWLVRMTFTHDWDEGIRKRARIQAKCQAGSKQ